MSEIDEEVKDNVNFIPVSDIKEVLAVAVLEKTQKAKPSKKKSLKPNAASNPEEASKEVSF